MKAAPEGVAMYIEFPENSLNFHDEPLEPNKQKDIELICNQLKIDHSTFQKISYLTRVLRDTEIEIKSQLNNKRDREKILKNVQKLANNLYLEMQELDNWDDYRLGKRLPPEKLLSIYKKEEYFSEGGRIREYLVVPAPESYFLYDSEEGCEGRIWHIGLEVKNLAVAANEELSSIDVDENKVGRKRKTHVYARHIESICNAVKNSNIKIGRGGDFEKLCNAVFEAAGIPAKAEGAIRVFLQES